MAGTGPAITGRGPGWGEGQDKERVPPRHSGAAQRSPEPITADEAGLDMVAPGVFSRRASWDGFRVRPAGASRNDGGGVSCPAGEGAASAGDGKAISGRRGS